MWKAGGFCCYPEPLWTHAKSDFYCYNYTGHTHTHTHTDSTTCLFQKCFIKTPKSDAVLNPCLSPTGNCFSGGGSETVACHCHGNVDVASRVMQSDSPTALWTPALPGTKSHTEKD